MVFSGEVKVPDDELRTRGGGTGRDFFDEGEQSFEVRFIDFDGMPLCFVGFFALWRGLGFCFGEEETILFAAQEREPLFEFETMRSGWMRGPGLEQFLFLLEE